MQTETESSSRRSSRESFPRRSFAILKLPPEDRTHPEHTRDTFPRGSGTMHSETQRLISLPRVCVAATAESAHPAFASATTTHAKHTRGTSQQTAKSLQA